MKYSLTKEQLNFVCNAGLMQLKQQVVNKVVHLFSDLAQRFQEDVAANTIKSEFGTGPKVSKGENYRGLPWVILDFPRNFGKQDIFAVRTFFWWGNFCSTTLHLSGNFLAMYKSKVQQAINDGIFDGWIIQVINDPWMHHYEAESHTDISKEETNVFELETTFLKIQKKIPLHEWDGMYDKLLENFKTVIDALEG